MSSCSHSPLDAVAKLQLGCGFHLASLPQRPVTQGHKGMLLRCLSFCRFTLSCRGLLQSGHWVLDHLPNQGPSCTQFDWTASSRKSPCGSRCLAFHNYCAHENTLEMVLYPCSDLYLTKCTLLFKSCTLLLDPVRTEDMVECPHPHLSKKTNTCKFPL